MAAVATQVSTSNPAAVPGAAQFASLYIGDLDPSVTESVLFEVFNAVGPVASIRVCRDTVTRRSLGYAYVNFHSIQDAERALNSLNYTPIKGRACRIMWSHRDPAIRKTGNGNVFVKNLDKSIDNKALYDTFSLFGNILSCKVSTDVDGKSRGFGFVHFETDESAKAAIEKLNGMQLGEKIVFVGEFQKTAERTDNAPKPFTNVYVKNIPKHLASEEKIKEVFEQFGPITSVHVTVDNKNRRFAFVNFDNFDSAHKAVEEMHGQDLRTEEEKEEYLKMKAERKVQKKLAQGAEVKDGEAVSEDDDESKELPAGEVREYLLYVQRAQSKTERMQLLKKQFQTTSPDSAKTALSTQGCNLYVKNLADDVDDAKLKAMFEPFGPTTSVRVMTDSSTGFSRGFGFVCFTSPDDAAKAVAEMHLKIIAGKPLYVGLHEQKELRVERIQNRYRPGTVSQPPQNFNRGFGQPGPVGNYGPSPYGANFGPRPGMPNVGFQPPMGGMPPAGRPMPNMMSGAFGPQGPRPGVGYPMGVPAPQLRGPAGMIGKGKGMMPQMMQPRPGMAGLVPGRGPMPGMPMGMPMNQPRPGQYPQQYDAQAPLTAAALAAAPMGVQKQMIGEKLFPLIARISPELAGKITGMMLEMDNSELLILLESEQQLRYKIEEAIKVLENK